MSACTNVQQKTRIFVCGLRGPAFAFVLLFVFTLTRNFARLRSAFHCAVCVASRFALLRSSQLVAVAVATLWPFAFIAFVLKPFILVY